MSPSRSISERAAHARSRPALDSNVWIATASPGGLAHMVPLSLAWIDDQIVVATPTDTVTARNVATSGQARAALDSADDVVIIDCDVQVVSFHDADPSMIEGYVERVGWNPTNQSGEWVLIILTPTRGQAWNGPGEMAGRTFIRDGLWLDTGAREAL